MCLLSQTDSRFRKYPPQPVRQCNGYERVEAGKNEMEMSKSTVEEIRQRFDGDVERFSNLETGQSATVDAPLSNPCFRRKKI